MLSFKIKRGDTSPALRFQAKDRASSNPIDLTGASVELLMASAAGVSKIAAAGVVESAANGIMRYNWQSVDTDTVGTYFATMRVTFGDGRIESFPLDSYIRVEIEKDLAA